MYVCHSILMRRVFEKRYRDPSKFVPLKAEYLQNIVGTNIWCEVKRQAMKIGLLECDESYSAGRYSKGYRLAKPFAESRPHMLAVTKKRLARRITQHRAERQEVDLTRLRRQGCNYELDLVRYLVGWLKSIEIADTETLPTDLPLYQDIAANFIRDKRFRWKFDRFGRFHTNITNLCRRLRPFLSVCGQSLVNIDISNSQPLFIGMLVKDQTSQAGRKEVREGGRESRHTYVSLFQSAVRQDTIAYSALPADSVQYLRLCEEGHLYEYLAEQAGLDLTVDEDARRRFKRRVLASMYDKDCHRNDVYRIINTCFPSVTAFLRKLKAENYRNAAWQAQRVESDFVFNRVVRRIMRELPKIFVATIHDSILTTQGNEEAVRAIMLDEFYKLGVHPKIDIED